MSDSPAPPCNSAALTATKSASANAIRQASQFGQLGHHTAERRGPRRTIGRGKSGIARPVRRRDRAPRARAVATLRRDVRQQGTN
jgi:hypothetical protein